MTKDEVAEATRAWVNAWDTHDVETLGRMEARSFGFGFRSLATRIGGMARQTLEEFFGGMESYRVRIDELDTSVVGEVGLAWGVFTEDFQQRGQPPERARIRFSTVFTTGPAGYQVELYHRDIQPFTEAATYPRALTELSG